jgi:hypothetical protein
MMDSDNSMNVLQSYNWCLVIGRMFPQSRRVETKLLSEHQSVRTLGLCTPPLLQLGVHVPCSCRSTRSDCPMRLHQPELFMYYYNVQSSTHMYIHMYIGIWYRGNYYFGTVQSATTYFIHMLLYYPLPLSRITILSHIILILSPIILLYWYPTFYIIPKFLACYPLLASNILT